MKKIIFTAFIILSLSSCFQNLFKVQTSNAWSKSHIDSIQHSDKTVIVHFRNDIKTMLSPKFDSNQISGQLGEYQALSKREISPGYPKKANAYNKGDKKILFGQVHVYVAEDFTGQNTITINRDNFAWTNVYAHDRKATTTNHLVSAGIILASLGLVFVLAITGI